MRIDAHVHQFTDGKQPFPFRDDMTTERSAYISPAEELIAYMDREDIDRTVLIQSAYHGYDNSYLCDCLRRYPDRLHGVALIDPRRADAAGELARLYRDHGVQGMRLYAILAPDASWLSADDQHQLWDAARLMGVPFTWFGHCAQIPMLEPMLQRYPEVKVIVDHLGEPTISEGLDGDFQLLLKAARFPNLYVKVTRLKGLSARCWPYADLHPLIRAALETFGARRMLACTGFPENAQRGAAVGFSLIEEGLEFLSAEDRRWILGDTADSLYG